MVLGEARLLLPPSSPSFQGEEKRAHSGFQKIERGVGSGGDSLPLKGGEIEWGSADTREQAQ
jgi:hypothetical protein